MREYVRILITAETRETQVLWCPRARAAPVLTDCGGGCAVPRRCLLRRQLDRKGHRASGQAGKKRPAQCCRGVWAHWRQMGRKLLVIMDNANHNIRLTHARGEWGLAHVFRSNRRATGIQTAKPPPPRSLPKVPTMGVWASELDHETMKGAGLNQVFFFNKMKTVTCAHCLSRKKMVPGCIMGKKNQASRGRVMLGAMLCWQTLGPVIHMDDIWHLPPTKTPRQSKYTSSWKQCSPTAEASFSRITHPASLQKWFEGHEKVLTRPPKSSDPSQIKHLWDVLVKHVCDLQD